MKELAYVLDIGSSKIRLFACSVKKGKSIIVTSTEKSYDGFMDGEFFSPEQFEQVTNELLFDMKKSLRKDISSIYVGVPTEFSACVCKRVTRSYVPAQKLTEEEVADMFDGVGDFAGQENYFVASYSPIQYELDGAQMIKLNNKRTSQFVMDCSYVLVKKQFVDFVSHCLKQCGVEEINFVSSALAQAQLAIKQTDSVLSPIVVVDVGHITTSVAVAKGEGLLMLSSFSLGGGHITADLMQLNNLNYWEAESIKHKVALTIQSKKDERYVVCDNGKTVNALINITNDIVKARIESIANVINKVLSFNSAFNDLPIYLTGDGLCNFRGVVNLIEAVTGRKVYVFKNPLDNGIEKYQTSKIALSQIIRDLV